MSDEPAQRPTYRVAMNRSAPRRQLKYVEGTMISPDECLLCVHDGAADDSSTPANSLPERSPDAAEE